MDTPPIAEPGIRLLPIRNTVAEEIEQSAREQHITVSDFLDSALRALRFWHFEQELAVLRAEAPATTYVPEDVSRLIQEVRSEIDLEHRR